jgi:iron complex outermembrane recepter protein
MIKRFIFAGCNVLLLASNNTHAQQTSSTEINKEREAAQKLETIIVQASADASAGGLKAPYAGGQVARGGRVGMLGSQDIMDTPFSISNYTQALIQNQQAASVADVLQNDSAVRVARGFGNFQQVYLVRGLPVFSDDMAYNGLYGLLPRQYLAAELLERVEVLRGASAFLNGAAPGGSGIGGAINVMPKRASNEALTSVTLGTETGGSLYAAADFSRRFGPDQNTGVRITAVRRDGDTAVERAQRELSVFAVGADFRARNVRVSGDLGFQDHSLTAAQPNITIGSALAIPTAPDSSRNIAQPWTFSNERDLFGTLRAEIDVAPQVVAWAAAGMREGKESGNFANPTVTSADGSSGTFRFQNARKDLVATGELGVRGKFETGGVKHTVSASAAAYSAKEKNAYGFSNFAGFAGNIYNPIDVAAPSADFFTGGKLDSPQLVGRTRTSSIAIADVISFADDHVLLTVGARRQKIETNSYDYNTGVENAAYSSSRVTPVAGVVFRPSKAVSIYATYIEGLVKGDVAPATSATQPVANAGEIFAPYQSKQTEVGVKIDTGSFGGVLSAFSTRKPIAGINVGNNRFEITDQQRNRGAELSVFGVLGSSVKILGGVSILDTDVAGKNGIGAPKSQANFGVEWAIEAVSGLSLDARVVRTASQFADAANTQTVPTWTRVDIGARYTFEVASRAVALRARVDNLANRNYWASAGGFPGAGYLTLSSPRTFVVSASVDF